MQSLRYLYRIGNGPSSSHTMGPIAAAKRFLLACPDADEYRVTLFGSLAKTGKGHMTDSAILEAFGEKKCEVIFDYDSSTEYHPNTLDISAIKNGEIALTRRFYSIGGGEVVIDGEHRAEHEEIYPLNSFTEIAAFCEEHDMRLWEYVEMIEGKEIWDYLGEIWNVMQAAVKRGITTEGTLHGGLGIGRKARYLYRHSSVDETEETRTNRMICAYAFAVSEENAAGGIIVTAPTCGACGVVPAVLKFLQTKKNFSDEDILHALATASIIGNLIKTNASISGAECGCQAEIGTACAMASAAAAELYRLNLDEIEYAAEMSIEHHLGLTCDPIGGLVQIPCIERNAVAAMRAINAVNLANFLSGSRKISLDMVIETMYQTGKDMSAHYRETSTGGLAKLYTKIK